jgi:hypothetical protein
MGLPILVLGESGSGKSSSLRNFEPGEIGILNVASKPLPFRKALPKIDKASYPIITRTLQKNTLKAYAVDDAQYLMTFSAFSRAKETGYGKFTDIALEYYNLIQTIINDTTPDTLVYLLQHIDTTDDGRIKAKTVGKMLDNQLTVEGMFAIVLLARTDGQRHWFDTQSDGYTTVKTPMEMFAEQEIDNDLKMVDTTIRDYYGFEPLKSKGE